jgi:hypothetical protein
MKHSETNRPIEQERRVIFPKNAFFLLQKVLLLHSNAAREELSIHTIEC